MSEQGLDSRDEMAEVAAPEATTEPLFERTWPAWPVIAGAAVAVAALVALLVTSGVVEAPTPRCMPIGRIPVAQEGQELVLVTDFEGAGGREAATELRRDIARRPGPSVVQTCESATDPDTARALGAQVGASLVVWGTVSADPMAVNLEVLQEPKAVRDEADYRVPARLPASYEFKFSGSLRQEAPFAGGVVSGYAAALNFDMDGARTEFEGALASQPEGTTRPEQERLDANAAQAHFGLGTLQLIVADDGASALENFDWALRLDPTFADAYYNRGVARLALGDPEAASAFTQAIDFAPDDAAAFNGRGVARHNRGDDEAALADFERAIALDADFAAAYTNRGTLYVEAGLLELAVIDFTAAIERDSSFAPAYKARAEVASALGDPEGALADLQVALALEPGYQAGYVDRGLAYYEVGAYHEALADFNQALLAQPDDFQTIFNRGRTNIRVGDYLGAISDLTTVLVQEPENAEAYLLRANAYFGRKNYAAAEADFNAALELEPGNADTYFVRGQARRALKQFDLALADYAQAIDGGYDAADIYLNRADVLFFDLAQPESALSDYAEALERESVLAQARHGQALALLELERYEEAEDAWRRLLDIDAFEGEHHAGLAVAIDAQGGRDAAIERYVQALVLDPGLIRVETLRNVYRWQPDGQALAAPLIEAVIETLTAQELARVQAEAEAVEAAAEATAQAPPPTAVPVEATPES